jgi:membrane protease YdiL (CAAX protease family)
VTLFMLGCAVVLAATSPLGKHLQGNLPELFVGSLAALLTLALTAVFVRWEARRLSDVGVALGRRSFPRLAAGFAIGVLLVAVWISIALVTARVRFIRTAGTDHGPALIALAAYVALSCREELAFHGYPLQTLTRHYSLWSAQLFVALVFAAEHRLGGLPWRTALMGTATGSLLFGMAAIATRGLAVPIGVHAGWNFGQWTLGLKGVPGFWRPVHDATSGTEGLFATITFATVMMLGTFAFWCWYRRGPDSASRSMPVR